jgi:hypothetical protein
LSAPPNCLQTPFLSDRPVVHSSSGPTDRSRLISSLPFTLRCCHKQTRSCHPPAKSMPLHHHHHLLLLLLRLILLPPYLPRSCPSPSSCAPSVSLGGASGHSYRLNAIDSRLINIMGELVWDTKETNTRLSHLREESLCATGPLSASSTIPICTGTIHLSFQALTVGLQFVLHPCTS